MRNYNIRERLKVYGEHHREVQKSETEVVWTHERTIPGIRRKTDTGDGTTWEKRKTEAEMAGLCQPRHESHQQKMKSMTELAGGELCLPQRPLD